MKGLTGGGVVDMRSQKGGWGHEVVQDCEGSAGSSGFNSEGEAKVWSRAGIGCDRF